MANTGNLEKLTIEAFTEKEDRNSSPEQEVSNQENTFTVMFNPTTFNRKYEIEYLNREEFGSGPRGAVFGKMVKQEYDFEFTIDGTGTSGPVVDVEEQIENFWRICGELRGDSHRPPYLRIRWGKFVLDVVLKLADVTYTLFKRDGSPLRAKITATFDENVDDDIQEARERKNSPDLSHLRTVKEGDLLPLMTKKIYGKNDSLYLEIAKFNNLNNFRRLKAGTQLTFPPLDKTTL